MISMGPCIPCTFMARNIPEMCKMKFKSFKIDGNRRSISKHVLQNHLLNKRTDDIVIVLIMLIVIIVVLIIHVNNKHSA